MRSFSFFVILCTLFFSVLATPVPSPESLERRAAFSGRGTWFDVGLGACGKVNQNSDLIVALSPGQYGSGGHCDQSVVITANGKTATATVRDKCPGCGQNDLDMSPALFSRFANQAVGVVQITWNFA